MLPTPEKTMGLQLLLLRINLPHLEPKLSTTISLHTVLHLTITTHLNVGERIPYDSSKFVTEGYSEILCSMC